MIKTDLENKLHELLKLPSENELVEFKEARTDFDKDKIGKYFSALSNEANLHRKSFAWLIFGVNNKHHIVGTNYKNQNNLQTLKHEIAQKISNTISFIDIYELNIEDKRVIMFQIPPAPKGIPISYDGHYYARNHESLVSLNIEKIERIRNQVINFDWTKENYSICYNKRFRRKCTKKKQE
jgi:ATP-dependent DNA helicase RecG